MYRQLAVIAACLSFNSFAVEVTCYVDYFALAHASDGSVTPVDPEQRKGTLTYVKGKSETKGFTVDGLQIDFTTADYLDETKVGGDGKYSGGVLIRIKDGDNLFDSWAKIREGAARLTHPRLNQPGVEPGETRRDKFWTVACRWKSGSRFPF